MFEKGKITSVESSYDKGEDPSKVVLKGWFLSFGDGGFFLKKQPRRQKSPKVGDDLEITTVNYNQVAKVTINGVVYQDKTAQDFEAEHEAFVAKLNAEKLVKFEKNKAQMDEDYNALPEAFKMRIANYRANNPNFRVEYEAYELFCCKEAIKIATALPTVELIQQFHALPYETQRAAITDLSNDHSGNTFGCACALAKAYLENPDFVVSKVHGALSPMVGSKEYGETV